MTASRTLAAVLFDWDGTLIDSYDADSQAYLALFHEMGVPWGLRELEHHYSPDWYVVYRAAGIPSARWPDADRIWRAYYAKHRPKLMSGARRVLGQLARHYELGLVTSGDRNRVMGQLREFGLLRVLRTRVCGGDLEEKKPHPAPLQMALRQMAIGPAECVYVGDTPEDVEMARAAGVRAIAVLGPFPTEKRLRAVHPEFLLNNLRKLPGLLRELYGEARRPRTCS